MPKRSPAKAAVSSPSPIAHGTWKELYELALQLRECKPWQTLSEADVFAVQTPGPKEETLYCVAVGMSDLRGLVIYRGAQGYAGYCYLRDSNGTPDPTEMLSRQSCLMVTFENRTDLRPADVAVIKSLGLSFRGAQAWPCFQSYRPGYLPWRLEPEEAALLLVTLRQALTMFPRITESPALLKPPVAGQILTRVQKDGAWVDEWLTPAPFHEPARTSGVDPVRVHAVLELSRPRRGTWQLGIINPGGFVDDGSTRPFPMRLALLVEGEAGMVLSADVLLPHADAEGLADAILKTMEEAAVWPTKLQVADALFCELLQPLGQALSLKVESGGDLPMLRSAMDALSTHLEM